MSEREAAEAPARLYLALTGLLLCGTGLLGFFFDSSFATGDGVASDDLLGILIVNGWRNVLYLALGLAALVTASPLPRAGAAVIGIVLIVLGIWGYRVTELEVGTIAGAIPVADRDSALHLLLGALGLAAAALSIAPRGQESR